MRKIDAALDLSWLPQRTSSMGRPSIDPELMTRILVVGVSLRDAVRAHLKRILKLGRLRLRGPRGAG
jgi:hypothetical protein